MPYDVAFPSYAAPLNSTWMVIISGPNIGEKLSMPLSVTYIFNNYISPAIILNDDLLNNIYLIKEPK